MPNLRTVVLGLLAVALLALLPAAPAAARFEARIASPAQVQAPAPLKLKVRTTRVHKRVALLVDGKRRWVRHTGGRRFVRVSRLHTGHLRAGRHRLTIRVLRRDGRIVKVRRTVNVIAARVSTLRPPPAPGAGALLDAGFEQGLANWNTAGVGDVVPSVASDVVRSGARAGKVVLTGSQDRSELILGGNGGGSTSGTAEFREGDERFYGFSVNVRQMVYGEPGAHNLIMQFKSDGEGSPNFGLQLWDYQGKKGLWSHSDAMDGDRFLAPLSEDAWHDLVVHFKASSRGAGFYRVYLDGQLIDQRDGVSMIVPGHRSGYVKSGLYRNGDELRGTSELRLDAGRLGTSLAAIGG